MNYQLTTQEQVRESFWSSFPEFKKEYTKTKVKVIDKNSVYGQSTKEYYRPKKQNEYRTDIRCAFVYHVDYLQRDGLISESLAQRVTL